MKSKRIYIDGISTDYSIEKDGNVYSHKYRQKNKLKIMTSISRTVELCIKNKKRKKFAVSKLMREYFPENQKFTASTFIKSMEYDKWYNIPDYNFKSLWNMIEFNYFKKTDFLLETDPSDQQFRKVKRRENIESIKKLIES